MSIGMSFDAATPEASGFAQGQHAKVGKVVKAADDDDDDDDDLWGSVWNRSDVEDIM